MILKTDDILYITTFCQKCKGNKHHAILYKDHGDIEELKEKGYEFKSLKGVDEDEVFVIFAGLCGECFQKQKNLGFNNKDAAKRISQYGFMRGKDWNKLVAKTKLGRNGSN